MGGLSRRATVIEQRSESIVVDVGGSLLAPGALRDEGAPQNRIKARLIAESLGASRLDVMTLASTDWELGPETVLSWTKELDLPVIAANLKCGDTAPFPAYKIVESGGKRLGFVGITGGQIDGCVLYNAVTSVEEAITAMGEVDIRILMLPKPMRTVTGLSGVDLVLSTHRGTLDDALSGQIEAMTLQNRGKTLGRVALTFSGHKGPWLVRGGENERISRRDRLTRRMEALRRRVGTANGPEDKERLTRSLTRVEQQVADLQAQLDAQASVDMSQKNVAAFDEIPLDRMVKDHPSTQQRVQAALSKIATEELGAHANTFFERVAVSNSVFLGADGCVGCHPAASKQWLTTGHAKAMTTLMAGGHQADRDCVPCHSTGYGAPGGPQSPAEVRGLRDVQCEACHGPGRDHAKAPKAHPMTRTPNESNCTFCHDGERDEGRFDKETYWPKIVHSAPER